jgi:hypothetical protein
MLMDMFYSSTEGIVKHRRRFHFHEVSSWLCFDNLWSEFYGCYFFIDKLHMHLVGSGGGRGPGPLAFKVLPHIFTKIIKLDVNLHKAPPRFLRKLYCHSFKGLLCYLVTF